MSCCRNCFNSLCRSCCLGSSCEVKPEDNENDIMPKIILYQHTNYEGKSIELNTACDKLGAYNFNDVVSSIKVESGNWTIYEHYEFKGASYNLTPGDYPDWNSWGGENDQISSVKPN